MAQKLSYTMMQCLKARSRGEDTVAAANITHRTYSALEQRGMVEWVFNPDRPWGGEWQVTDAGRAALPKPVTQ